MKRIRVFFDGSCPMCRKEIQVYRTADLDGAVEWCDVSAETHATALPLPRTALLARFHVQRPTGELISGARAFIALWQTLPKWNILARVCSTPGIPHLLELAYRLFLKLRPRLQRMFAN